MPAAIGIALTGGSDGSKLEHSMFTVPLGMLLNLFVLLIWRVGPNQFGMQGRSLRWQIAGLVLISLLFWSISALGLVFLLQYLNQFTNAIVLAVGITTTALTLVFGIVFACVRPIPAPGGRVQVSLATYVARGSLATLSVTIAVLLSHASFIAAGMASTFPAIFLTTMISLYFTQGANVPAGAAPNMMLGSVAVSGYAMLFGGIEPALIARGHPLGTAIFLATIFSYAISVLFISVPVVIGLNKRASRFSLQRQESSMQTGGMEDTPGSGNAGPPLSHHQRVQSSIGGLDVLADLVEPAEDPFVYLSPMRSHLMSKSPLSLIHI